MRPRRFFALLFLSILVSSVGQARAQAEESTEAAPPPLSIESISIQPTSPKADSLCQLRVAVKNAGDQAITALAFEVEVSGQDLPVYGNQLFYQELPAGKTTEVQLFNFWVSETGRAAPTDGKLKVKVTVREAAWLTIETAEDGTEVWKTGEAVPGLPAAQEVTVALAGAAAAPAH